MTVWNADGKGSWKEEAEGRERERDHSSTLTHTHGTSWPKSRRMRWPLLLNFK